MKECTACYKEFSPRYSHQAYCSKRCVDAAYRDKKRKCLLPSKPKKDSHIPDMIADKTAYDYFQA